MSDRVVFGSGRHVNFGLQWVLCSIFQWLTEEPSRSVADRSDVLVHVREELADVGIYLLRLADTLDVDLGAAIEAKIAEPLAP